MKLYFKDVRINTIPDNDLSYFKLLEGIVNSIDVDSEMVIQRTLNSYYIRISISAIDCINLVIKELNSLHNLLLIKINYSKSIKYSSLIAFNIEM
jgi:hypothetical protein